VQSGDDEVLRDMKRGHTVEDFEAVVDAFRKNFDDLTLSTDVIVGYPTEGDASFWKTYRLIEEVRPDILNITRFSPRPRTKAAELKDILDRDKKDRSRKLTLLHKKIGKENNRRYLGRELEVLITEEGKDGTLLARTNSYKQVVLRKGVIGEFTRAKIKEAMPTYLIGE
jgi:tRNA A37 methylthiotransferase MiaB